MKHLIFAALLSALGAIDPNCTVKDICQPGYTATVRPPASFTNKLKALQMKALGLTGDLNQYEEDHEIPLELCGAPRDPNNLWPQPWPQARLKDKDETRLHRAVCKGAITLETAQREIKKRWGTP